MRYVLGGLALIALIVAMATGTTTGQILSMPGSNACFLRLYTTLPPEARIAFIGSSRIRRGVQVDVVSKALDLPPAGVMNLGHPTDSLPLDYALMNRLTRDHPLDVIVFEVQARSAALEDAEYGLLPRDYAPIRLSSGEVKLKYVLGAPVRDQARLVFAVADNRLLAAWDFSRLYAERIRQFIPSVVTQVKQAVLGAPQQPQGAPHPATPRIRNEKRAQDCFQARWDAPTETAQHGDAKALRKKRLYRDFFPGWQDPAPLGFLTDDRFDIERAVIRDMIALAERRGATPVFLYVPSMHVPVTPDLATAFARDFGVSLLVPPPALHAALAAERQYYDNSHLNTAGRARFSAWLADQLRLYLPSQS